MAYFRVFSMCQNGIKSDGRRCQKRNRIDTFDDYDRRHTHTFPWVLLGFLHVFPNKNSTGFGPFNRIDFDTVVMRGLHRGYKWSAVPKITEKRPYFGSLSRVHTYYTCLPVTPITALFTIQDGITILLSTEASCGVSTSMMTSS